MLVALRTPQFHPQNPPDKTTVFMLPISQKLLLLLRNHRHENCCLLTYRFQVFYNKSNQNAILRSYL